MSQVTPGKDTSIRGVEDETGTHAGRLGGSGEAGHAAGGGADARRCRRSNGAAAMPGPAPAEQVNFAGGPAAGGPADGRRAGHREAPGGLERAATAGGGAAKKERRGARGHGARRDPGGRVGRAGCGARREPAAGASAAMAGMGRDKAGALARVAGAKTDTKSKDEVERARISGEINKIFDETKADVEVILNGVDGKVTAEFDKGEGAARSAFTAKHKADMDKYKDDRYSGVTGAARWTADLFTGLPAEANKIYDAAKALYESQMTVGHLQRRRPDRARARRGQGAGARRAGSRSSTTSRQQPAALQKLAGEAAKDVTGKFDQLDADVDAKQQSLVDDLAEQVHRGQRQGRRGDQGRAGEEQGAGRQGQGGHRRRDRHHPQVEGAVHRSAGQGRRPRSPRSSRTRSRSSPTSCPRSSRASCRSPANILDAPEEGSAGLAVRGAGQCRHRTARFLRPEGHSQAGRVDPRVDLDEHQDADRQDGAVGGDGDRRHREQDRDLHDPGDPGHRRACGTGSRKSSAT